MTPYLEIILAAIIWGSSGVFVKYLDLPPTTLSFFRFAIPTLLLLGYFVSRKRPFWHAHNQWILLGSTLQAVSMFLYLLALTLTSLGNAVIMLYTWPLFLTVLGILFLGERASKKNLLLVLTAFLGLIVIYLSQPISFASQDFVGMSAMLGCAFFYTFTVLIFKKEGGRYSRLETVYYQNFVGALVFLPFLFLNHPAPTLGQFSLSAGYAILIGMVGYGLFFSGLKKVKATTAATLSYLEVVSAIAFGIVLFGEPLTWNIVLGGSLIVGSAMLLRK